MASRASLTEVATALLQAFAISDLATIDRLCAADVILWGTDIGETWEGKPDVLASFDGVFDLDVHWVGDPIVGDDWLAGNAEFILADGSVLASRVTMVFRDGLLTHGHYSVAAEPAT